MSSERDRIRAECLAALETGEGVIDIGRMVLCDICDADLTDDPRSGGYIFAGSGYGPCCAAKSLETIRRFDEESHITARCPAGVSFADWIRDLRGGNSTIVVASSYEY